MCLLPVGCHCLLRRRSGERGNTHAWRNTFIHASIYFCLSIRKYIKTLGFILIFRFFFFFHPYISNSGPTPPRVHSISLLFLTVRNLSLIVHKVSAFLYNTSKHIFSKQSIQPKYCFPTLLQLVLLLPIAFSGIILFTCNPDWFVVLCMPFWVSPTYPGLFGLFICLLGI